MIKIILLVLSTFFMVLVNCSKYAERTGYVYQKGVLIAEKKYMKNGGFEYVGVKSDSGVVTEYLVDNNSDTILTAIDIYKDGLRHGKSVTYEKNTKTPMVETSFKNGKMHGEYKSYIDGKIEYIKYFENGTKIKEKVCFDQEGNKVNCDEAYLKSWAEYFESKKK